VLQDVLDPVQLGIAFRVGGLLPGLDALEGDAAAQQQAAGLRIDQWVNGWPSLV
jgi:hypothetical protein